MNTKENNSIIKNYRPHKGFYDLSEKPKTLTKLEYAKVLKIQEFLVEQNNNIEYLKEFEPRQYEDIKELSGNYQGIIRKHWGDKI